MYVSIEISAWTDSPFGFTGTGTEARFSIGAVVTALAAAGLRSTTFAAGAGPQAGNAETVVRDQRNLSTEFVESCVRS